MQTTPQHTNKLYLRLLAITWVFSNFSCLNGQFGAGATKLLNIIAQFASKWNLTFLFANNTTTY
jgi:ABC-type lipoprotein export system ATPase subunit